MGAMYYGAVEVVSYFSGKCDEAIHQALDYADCLKENGYIK